MPQRQSSGSLSRRTFLQAAGTAAAAFPLVSPAWIKAAEAPSERIRVAFIGTGNQGMLLLRNFLKFDLGDVVAVCDVNQGSYGYKEESHFYGREPAQQLVNEHYTKNRTKGTWKSCQAFTDFRDVLALPDVDAVFLVVPDHWHAAMTLLAAAAGKNIYCEKPASLHVVEGREMVNAVRKHKVLFQVGSHERSNPVSQFICEAVQAGRIGEVKKVITKVGYNNKVGPGPGWKPMPVPSTFDYETWLGPAPEAPYHVDRCLYRFRFNYDYSGGQITNFGAHCNDMAQWALGLDQSGPVEVECLDAKFLPEGSLFNTATETRFRCKYANGLELLCESGPEQVQVRFEGTDGWLQTGYKGTTASSPNLLEGLPQKNGTDGLDPHSRHMRAFVTSVKAGKEPAANVEVGHSSATLCHLANVAIRQFPKTGPGHVLKWDPKAERFSNDDDANAMLDVKWREPWQSVRG
ncbi:Gfo/Idh/MocA family protein [Planctomicrobium piriforme]|uniref:Tat (Twin-arginine translocation) pathway signal sequence n=1 Tax=Planctomicrobium piriforme TaxID=1576369 RepID=A0A1I3PCU4_9PLAN|nr:Gfo/Idh/MocA family oxidoreductase [Planctomicrobium piriforme]SFJ19335.1 Tat (twin-arginine translocation) pathway signal sequence [Planctomicrobium piriforme]